MRPIDADALMNELRSMVKYENDGAVDCGSYNAAIIDAKAAISSAPTISPDEVRGVGEWITTRTWEHDGDPYCSKCGFEQSYMRFEKFKFCPSCGARMKGE